MLWPARAQGGVFRGEKIAARAGSRCTGNNELVRRKAWTFVGLKHPIAKRVLLRQREVRLNVSRFDIHVLRIGMRVWRAIGRRRAGDQVRSVHLAAVVHGNESGIGMAEVVVLRARPGCAQVDGTKRNSLPRGIQAAAGDVGAAGYEHRILEQIVRRAVFLKDDDDVLEHSGRRQGQRLRAVAGSHTLGVASGNDDGVVPARSPGRSRYRQHRSSWSTAADRHRRRAEGATGSRSAPADHAARKADAARIAVYRSHRDGRSRCISGGDGLGVQRCGAKRVTWLARWPRGRAGVATAEAEEYCAQAEECAGDE